MAAYNASMATLMNELTRRQQEEAAQAATASTTATALMQPANKFPKVVTIFLQLNNNCLQCIPMWLSNTGKQEALFSLQALAENQAGEEGSSGLAPANHYTCHPAMYTVWTLWLHQC